MTNKLSTLTCACALTLGLTSAQAALLGEYTFDSNSAAATNVASVVDMSAWDATTGTSTGTISAGSAFINASETPGNNNINPATPTSYHAFSFTVQNLGVGETLSITSISGDFFGNIHGGTSGNSGHRIALFSDQVGYTDNGDRIGDEVWIDKNPATARPESISFDISTITTSALSNLSNDEVVEFRFYFSDSSSNSLVNSRLDNIKLNGTVIPEPGSYALLGGCLALAWVMVRRRRA